MLKKFVTAWYENKDKIQATFEQGHPDNYADVVKAVIGAFPQEYGWPDAERIHQIDDGDYQGTLIFVIGEFGYQPSTYWYISISYGSCSGCDTLERILSKDVYPAGAPTEDQVKDYMSLALHVVQQIKEMYDAPEDDVK